MESLTISILDDDTVEALRRKADLDGKSIEQEAADLIRQGVGATERRWDRAELLAEARRIQAMTPKGVEQTPSEVLVREDRDR